MYFDLNNSHIGCVCYNEKEEAGVILSIELKSKKKGLYQAVGVFLDGDFDCEYKRTKLNNVKTRKGWKGTKLEMIGLIDGNDLENALALADTGKSFGIEEEEKT